MRQLGWSVFVSLLGAFAATFVRFADHIGGSAGAAKFGCEIFENVLMLSLDVPIRR